MKIANLKISFSKQERQWILNRIDESLKKGFVSQGKNVLELESAFAKYVNTEHAIAVNSGSSAIELVMKALGVKGKEVIIPTNTFLATATGVLFAGGTVKLADIDENTFSISLEEIKRQRTDKTVGVIIVHIGGIISPEINAIKDYCEKEGLWLFEDAAHAHGSKLENKHAGTFGIAGSYSLFATKVITSGEGGIIVTDDDELCEKLKLLRNHGKPEAWKTYHTVISSNYRMSDITAAVGLAQFNNLEDKIHKRKIVAELYTKKIKEKLPHLKLLIPTEKTNWYKYIAILPQGVDKDEIKSMLKESGVELQGEVYETPLHKQPIAEELGVVGRFDNCNRIAKNHICLPIYPDLSVTEVEYVVEQLCKAILEKEGENEARNFS